MLAPAKMYRRPVASCPGVIYYSHDAGVTWAGARINLSATSESRT